jgi:hypothetical protein
MSHQMKTTPTWSKALGLISVIVAGAAGIGIGVTALFIAFSDPLPGPSGRNNVPMVSALVTAGLICASVCLALGSRISLSRIVWLLLGAAIAGLIVTSLFLLLAFRNLQTD